MESYRNGYVFIETATQKFPRKEERCCSHFALGKRQWQTVRGNFLSVSQSHRQCLGQRVEEDLPVHLCCEACTEAAAFLTSETFIGHERGENSKTGFAGLCCFELLLSQAFVPMRWFPSHRGVLHREDHGAQLSTILHPYYMQNITEKML